MVKENGKFYVKSCGKNSLTLFKAGNFEIEKWNWNTWNKRKIRVIHWATGKVWGKWPVVAEWWSCCTNKILQDLYIFSDSCVHNFCYSVNMTVFKGEDWPQRHVSQQEQKVNIISRSFCKGGEVCFIMLEQEQLFQVDSSFFTQILSCIWSGMMIEVLEERRWTGMVAVYGNSIVWWESWNGYGPEQLKPSMMCAYSGWHYSWAVCSSFALLSLPHQFCNSWRKRQTKPSHSWWSEKECETQNSRRDALCPVHSPATCNAGTFQVTSCISLLVPFASQCPRCCTVDIRREGGGRICSISKLVALAWLKI